MVAPDGAAPRTALVLGGGGSRGAVGVGLYRALVELGVRIDMLVCCSIGAVNGALIAAGMSPEELEASWKALRTRDVLGSRLQFLRLFAGSTSLFNNKSLRALLTRQLPVRTFHELRIPLSIVTTDLETGDSVVLMEGDLIEAILASTALPGLFPPIELQGRRLVDGGLSNNVPIDLAVALGAERVIGMLCGCGKGLPSRPNMITVLGQSFSLAINARYRCDSRMYQPRAHLHILDPCLEPTLELLDFDRGWLLVEPAYQCALQALKHQLT